MRNEYLIRKTVPDEVRARHEPAQGVEGSEQLGLADESGLAQCDEPDP